MRLLQIIMQKAKKYAKKYVNNIQNGKDKLVDKINRITKQIKYNKACKKFLERKRRKRK